MKHRFLAVFIFSAFALSACSPQFWGGAGLGALGTGAGYEYQAKRQMDQLEDDYKAGRITREEYLDRKNQIERGSLIY